MIDLPQEEPCVSWTADLQWSNLGIMFSNPDVFFITDQLNMREQMGRHCVLFPVYLRINLPIFPLFRYEVLEACCEFY